jgi:hypothetical protein
MNKVTAKSPFNPYLDFYTCRLIRCALLFSNEGFLEKTFFKAPEYSGAFFILKPVRDVNSLVTVITTNSDRLIIKKKTWISKVLISTRGLPLA